MAITFPKNNNENRKSSRLYITVRCYHMCLLASRMVSPCCSDMKRVKGAVLCTVTLVLVLPSRYFAN